MIFNVWNWSLPRSEGKVQNWVRRWSYYLNVCEAHGLNNWGQLPHLMQNGRKVSIMLRTSCSSLSRVLSTRSSCSTPPTSPIIAGLWKFYYVSSNNTKWEYEWTSTKETCYKPSHRTTNKHGETRYRLNCHKERCNRKRVHTHFLKDRNCECRRAWTTWTLCWRRTGEAIPRAGKFGRIHNSRAQSLERDLWIGKQPPIRCRGAKFGSLKIRDETKLLKADMESFPGIWH